MKEIEWKRVVVAAAFRASPYPGPSSLASTGADEGRWMALGALGTCRACDTPSNPSPRISPGGLGPGPLNTQLLPVRRVLVPGMPPPVFGPPSRSHRHGHPMTGFIHVGRPMHRRRTAGLVTKRPRPRAQLGLNLSLKRPKWPLVMPLNPSPLNKTELIISCQRGSINGPRLPVGRSCSVGAGVDSTMRMARGLAPLRWRAPR